MGLLGLSRSPRRAGDAEGRQRFCLSSPQAFSPGAGMMRCSYHKTLLQTAGLYDSSLQETGQQAVLCTHTSPHLTAKYTHLVTLLRNHLFYPQSAESPRCPSDSRAQHGKEQPGSRGWAEPRVSPCMVQPLTNTPRLVCAAVGPHSLAAVSSPQGPAAIPHPGGKLFRLQRLPGELYF